MIANVFLTKTREEWTKIFSGQQLSDSLSLCAKIMPCKKKTIITARSQKFFLGIDACVEPVLSMNEAPQHPHNR